VLVAPALDITEQFWQGLSQEQQQQAQQTVSRRAGLVLNVRAACSRARVLLCAWLLCAHCRALQRQAVGR
jgi:hypothetical protein